MGQAKREQEKYDDAYRKRFKCPECSGTNYHLHVQSRSYAECEEGFMTSDRDLIKKVVDEDDFEGYFSDEELENNFI